MWQKKSRRQSIWDFGLRRSAIASVESRESSKELRFEIYSTDESGSLNKSLKLWVAGESWYTSIRFSAMSKSHLNSLPDSHKVCLEACIKLLQRNRSNSWHSPTIKVRGFLIQRLTFKCCVLSAILRPFNRRILPINEPDSQPPQRVCLQKRTRIFI